jgi:capsular polysaccharide transport system ATP-binding protein
MIILENVGKLYPTRSGPKTILEDVNLHIEPGEKVGILGRNGAGKSTLIRLISGAELPTSGNIDRSMSVSWPLAFGGAFQSALTGYDNLRFICRIYGVDPDDKEPFVQEFSELGIYLREPVRTYSSGMRARLAFAISMVIEFDCFLIDEIVSVGDSRFQEKCHAELFVKRADRAMIFVSHDANYIREHCTRALVLRDGKLHDFPTIDEAYHWYYAD